MRHRSVNDNRKNKRPGRTGRAPALTHGAQVAGLLALLSLPAAVLAQTGGQDPSQPPDDAATAPPVQFDETAPPPAPPPGAAEAPIHTASAAPQSGPPQGLQEVVVTAQFRNENVQNTPLAISAVSAAALEERGQTRLSQITSDVPSVSLIPSTTAFGPSMSAFIRGVGQADLDPALEPGVGIYVDDVYLGTITASLLDLLDLDRVEVLRGPQGTLEGMNSEGGAVKLFSKLPDAHPTNHFALLLGSRNHVELRAASNFALTDNLFIRLSGVGNFQNGYENIFDFGCANPSFTATPVVIGPPGTITNGPTGSYSVAPAFVTRANTCSLGTQGGTGYAAARVALRWLVNDRLEAILIGDITNENRENPAETLLYAGPAPKISSVTGLPTVQSPNADFITIPTTSGALLPYDETKVPAILPKNPFATYATFCMPAITNPVNLGPPLGDNFNQPAVCGQNRTTLNSWGSSLTINWKPSETVSVKNIVALRGYTATWFEDNDGSPWPAGLGGDVLSHHQLSEEFRLNGSWEHLLDWTAGAFYFNEKSVYATHQDLWYPLINVAPGLLNFIQDDPIVAHDRAGYLHTVWHFLPRLDLTLAGRYTSQDKDYTYVRLNPQGGTGGSATLVGSLNGYTGKYAAHRFDYRANVAYHFTDQLLGYAQVSTGFKGGGVNPRPFFVQQAIPFNPETLTSYELGLKTTWLDNHVHLNIDGYFSQYRDVQLALLNCGFVPSIGPTFGTPCALPYNAGDAHVKGAELDGQARFGGLQLDASFGYLNFEYVHLNYQTAATFPACPAIPVGLLCPVTGVTYGMVTPYTPKLTGNVGLQYTYELPFNENAGSLTGRIDMTTRSEIWTNAVNDNYNRIGGFTLWNARLNWEPPKGNWQIGVQVLNFTDKLYYMNVFDLAAAGGGSVVGNPGPPLEIDVEFKHSFL
jgi:iron complex outermembrane receptor protein